MLVKFRRLSAATASEDELGLKWDRCVADLMLKTGDKFKFNAQCVQSGTIQKLVFSFL